MGCPDEDNVISHGVLLVVFDCGVLLTGESGVGKSSLALELIRRGHRLIADDTPLFRRSRYNTQLIGRCLDLLRDFLAVPGLGVVNIRAIYGDQAIAIEHPLDLVIRLAPDKSIEPLTRSLDEWERLEVKVPQLTLPLTSHMPSATIVETAVQDHHLRRKGYDALLAFQQRHRALINPPSKQE